MAENSICITFFVGVPLLQQRLGVFLQTTTAKVVYWVGCWGLAGLFLWSGVSKVSAPGFFAETIAAFGLMPDLLIYPAAIFLISIELAVGIGLLVGKRWALSGATLLMLLFLMVLGYGVYLGLDIDCGCFGPNDPEAAAFHDMKGAFFRDLLLMLVLFYLFLWRFANRPKKRIGGNSAQIIVEEA